jgi:hypothetical protein
LRSIDNLGECRIQLSQCLQGLSDPLQFAMINRILHGVRSQRGNFEQAAALLCLPFTRMVDDQPPHHLRRISHEPRAIGERPGSALRHSEIGFVQKSRRAQAHRPTLPCQLDLSDSMELRVQSGEERFVCAPVPALGGRH